MMWDRSFFERRFSQCRSPATVKLRNKSTETLALSRPGGTKGILVKV
jgi:hypothetical protein